LKVNFACSGTIQRTQNVQERTLAGPGSSLDGEHFSGEDGQVDPFQDFNNFGALPKNKRFSEIANMEKRLAGRGR